MEIEDFLGGLFIFLLIIWWLVKVVALVIFAFALIAVLGALLNDNSPASHDIAWLIISLIAMIVL